MNDMWRPEHYPHAPTTIRHLIKTVNGSSLILCPFLLNQKSILFSRALENVKPSDTRARDTCVCADPKWEVHPVNVSPSWPSKGKIIDKSNHYMYCQT